MQIFVKDADGKTLTLKVAPDERIADVKAKIREQRSDVPDDALLITEQGRQAEEGSWVFPEDFAEATYGEHPC